MTFRTKSLSIDVTAHWRIQGAPPVRAPKGPDPFVLTQIFRNIAASGVGAPLRGRCPPMGNPGSATAALFQRELFYSFLETIRVIIRLNNRYCCPYC